MNNKRFWKKVLIIGVPVALQNLINTILNMSDTLMISSLGDMYVSSVGLANKVFFVFNLLMFGIVSGCSILISQYYGKNDDSGINKVFGFCLMLAIAAGMIFSLWAIFIPSVIMGLFTKSNDLIVTGSSYLRIVGISYIFTALSMSITALLRSCNKTRLPMFVTLFCVGINIIINYIFIFGKFGAKAMMADGAAVGTVVSRGIEFIILCLILLFCKRDFILKFKMMVSLDNKFIKRILKISYPVILNEFLWGLGTTIYSVIYGHMSDHVVAVMTIAAVVQDLVWVFLLGISNACAVLIGNELGASNFDSARVIAKKLLLANFIFGIILSIILVFIVKYYLMLYPNISDLVKNDIVKVCYVYAIALPFKAFNLTNICGVLRSGGDTLFCMCLDLFGVWAIAIPCGAISGLVFKMDIMWVFGFICLEEVFKIFIGVYRYKKEKWVCNIVV